jgi:arsenite methyltransferase
LQVYAYVKELDEALAELDRVLKPGGRIVILDTDLSGIVWQSRNRDRMRKILAAYDNHVAWPDLPRILPQRLRAAGFHLDRCEVVPMLTLNYHPNTYVHGIARFIRRFVTEHAGIAAEEADAWMAEFDDLEHEGAFLFAMNRFLFVATKPA